MPSRTKKFRGLRTHGRGKKSGRGAGIIGGHGKAGLGKTKKIQMIKLNKASKHDYYGRHGFKRPQSVVADNNTINVAELAEQLDRFVELGFATKDGDVYNVNLTEAGIDKLLGNGKIEAKVNVTVDQASACALEKIQTAGGSIVGFEAEESDEE